MSLRQWTADPCTAWREVAYCPGIKTHPMKHRNTTKNGRSPESFFLVLLLVAGLIGIFAVMRQKKDEGRVDVEKVLMNEDAFSARTTETESAIRFDWLRKKLNKQVKAVLQFAPLWLFLDICTSIPPTWKGSDNYWSNQPSVYVITSATGSESLVPASACTSFMAPLSLWARPFSSISLPLSGSISNVICEEAASFSGNSFFSRKL